MIKSKKKFIIKLILVIIWLGVIFYLSNSNGYETGKQSHFISKIAITNTLKVTNLFQITNVDLTNKNEIDIIIDKYHPFIRKIAHFTEFFVLSILVLLLIQETLLDKKYLFVVMFCLTIAIWDEIHQLFISQRNGNLIDVLIDTSGGITYCIINKIYHLIKKK